jgi:hemerythrin-like metal-binding protein
MPLITWETSYELGISEIDNQHKKMVEIINRLFQMFSEHKVQDEEALKTVLQELTDYANYHFSTEEKYFALLNYPGTENHIAKHNQYREKIEEFKTQLAANKTESTFFNLTNFLQDWWVWHINNVDREYVPLFLAQGVK